MTKEIAVTAREMQQFTSEGLLKIGGEQPVKIKYERNLGMLDRILRAGASLLMIYFGFFTQSLIDDALARMVLGVIGVMNLFIAIVAFCPLYALVGFNTASPRVNNAQ